MPRIEDIKLKVTAITNGVPDATIPGEEPVAFGNAVEGLILAVLAVLSAFGVVTLTDEQTAALLSVWIWGLAVQSILVRRKVSPVGTSTESTNFGEL